MFDYQGRIAEFLSIHSLGWVELAVPCSAGPRQGGFAGPCLMSDPTYGFNPITGTMVNKGNHPQMAQQFRLVKYYSLPRFIDIVRYCF